jgi:glycosyltransferase involved in cell wall biosynthesis
MRILIAEDAYYAGSNGQAVFARNLAEGLARAGHEVLVVTQVETAAPRYQQRNGVTLYKWPSIYARIFHPDAYLPLPVNFDLPRVFERFRPQVAHIQDHYPLTWRVAEQAQKRGIPILGTNHFLPQNIFYYFPTWLPISRERLERLLWWNMLGLYNRFDHVTTPTETAAAILRRQPIRPPVTAVSCGVDTTRFCPGPRPAPGTARFLYVGRVEPDKRLDVLVRGFAQLNRADAELEIVGKGNWHIQELKALAQQLGVAGRVRLRGYVPEADLPAAYRAADFFCMPSPVELQSIASLEAMASGLPVLAARARALPELVEHGVNGYLFEPNDPADAARGLAFLLDARPTWEQMSQASLSRARAHSLENTIRRYEGLYMTLVGRG